MIKEAVYETFDGEIMHCDRPVLLIFGAEWCRHCRSMEPIIVNIEKERTDIAVYHVDVDKQPALAERFSVQSIPALFVIKNGNNTERMTGAQPKHRILALLD